MTYKKLSAIDDTIDHPSRKASLFNDLTMRLPFPNPKTGRRYYNPYDAYGITGESQHRQYLHDPLTAGVVTFLEHGPDSIGPMQLHLMLDGLSKELKRQHGAMGRDFIELQMNMVLDSVLRRKGYKSFMGHRY